MQGFHLSDFETLPWIYQQHHPERAVTNYGTSYYGTYQSLLALKRALAATDRPEVYYLFNTGHEDRNVAVASWPRVVKAPPPGFFYPYATLVNDRIQDNRSKGDVVWPLSWYSRIVATVEEYYELAKAYPHTRNRRAVTQQLLADMDAAVRAKGGHFIVILFDAEPEDRKEYVEFLEAHKIAYLNCDRTELRDPSFRLIDWHPNQKLHAALAGWITQLSGSASSC